MTKKPPAVTIIPVRERNGRLARGLVPPGAVSPAEAYRLRQAALIGMRSPEWGSELGRLYLAEKIESSQYEAGKSWRVVVEQYRQAVGAPSPHPRGQKYERASPATLPDDPPLGTRAGDRLLRIRKLMIDRMIDAQEVLIAAGRDELRQIRATVEDEQAPVGHHSLLILRSGLTALSIHWGLTKPMKTEHVS